MSTIDIISRMKQHTVLRKEKSKRETFLSANRVLYFLYYLLGGVYLSDSVSRQFKRIWILVNFLNLFIFFIAAIIYYTIIHIHQPIEIFDFLSLTLASSIVFQIVIFIPIITIYFRNEILYVLEFVNSPENTRTRLFSENGTNLSDFSPLELRNSSLLKKLNPVKVPLFLLFCTVTLVLFYMAFPVLAATFFSDGGVPQKIEYHIFPIPGYDHITSYKMYYAICMIECLLAVSLDVAGSIHPTFFLIMCILLSNMIVDYCERIRRLSLILTERIERDSMSTNRFAGTKCVTYDWRADFEKDLVKLTKEYLTFIKSIKIIQPYVNIFYSLMVLTTVVTQFCNVYITLGTSMSVMFKLKQILFGLCVGIYLYIMCHIGKMFDDMGEAIRYEIYNLPWYLMPPQTRRIINIMQAVVYKHHEYKVFIIYPVTMALFPRVMNAVYSYFNILRTAINRKGLE